MGGGTDLPPAALGVRLSGGDPGRVLAAGGGLCPVQQPGGRPHGGGAGGRAGGSPTAAWLYPPLRREVQYACHQYVNLLAEAGMQISMSRRGHPYDNAQAESFLKTLKHEKVNLTQYRNIEETAASIGALIEQVWVANLRILLLTQWFQPEPMFKGLAFARALRDRGHDVEVLTGFPNYPGGKLYPGYRVRLYQREVMDGITVHRVPLCPSHDRSGLRRSANYLSFAISAATLGPLLVGTPDVVYVYNLPTLGYAARMTRWLRKARVIVDVQDLWPEALSGSGMVRAPLLLSIAGRWCAAFYRAADMVVTLSPGYRRCLLQRGVPDEQVEVIYNWCDEEEMHAAEPDPSLSSRLGFPGRFNVVFAGTMGTAQALDAVINAAEIVHTRASDVLFTFVGGGVDAGRLKASARHLPNVQFVSRQPASIVSAILRSADLLLVHLKRDPLYHITIPSKLQAYMYTGRPILVAVSGDAADLVRQARAGFACDQEDPAGIAEAVLRMRNMPRGQLVAMGENGRAFYRDHLAMERGVDRFVSVFEQALERRRTHTEREQAP